MEEAYDNRYLSDKHWGLTAMVDKIFTNQKDKAMASIYLRSVANGELFYYDENKNLKTFNLFGDVVPSMGKSLRMNLPQPLQIQFFNGVYNELRTLSKRQENDPDAPTVQDSVVRVIKKYPTYKRTEKAYEDALDAGKTEDEAARLAIWALVSPYKGRTVSDE